MILDTSALLALIFQETGKAIVQAALPNSLINTVTYAELCYKLGQKKLDVRKNMNYLEAAGLKILGFSRQEAELSAHLQPYTQPLGLSLGDRTCLASSIHLGLPCLTADKVWLDLSFEGLEVKCIR